MVTHIIGDLANFEPPDVRYADKGVIHIPTTWFREFIVKINSIHEFYLSDPRRGGNNLHKYPIANA